MAMTQRSGRPRSAPRRVTVRSVAQLSPRMRRVTFEGSDLSTFAWSGPAAHIKLIPPDPGSDTTPVPDPDGPRPASVRTYTPRRFDPDSCTLEVDFVLHGDGPASSWAARAGVGQQLVIMGPAPGYPVDAAADWYVLLCDDAALPAIESILEALPPSMPVTVFVEVAAAGEERPLSGPAGAVVHWLEREDDPALAGSALHRAMETFAWPRGDGRVYVGCESNAMRSLRPVILAASGLEKSRVITRGYWRNGTPNNPDRDYAED
jgi:NADPH-dependent ferric siderophore reductase